MPDIEWNRQVWDDRAFTNNGDEWSSAWGNPAVQWYWSLLPRISPYVPAATILEIAPGFGRWTHWLKDLCQKLIVVDLSPSCIEGCRKRFAHCTHIDYHVNDGLSLAMVPDTAIDFAFSFDSLVHVEIEVMTSYLSELSRKLAPNGVAFLHHSNLGEYAPVIRRWQRLPMGRHRFERWGWIECNPNSRAMSVTAEACRQIAARNGLSCIAQELFNWGESRRLSECISVVTPQGSRWDRPVRILRNPHFMAEAAQAAERGHLYDHIGTARSREAEKSR